MHKSLSTTIVTREQNRNWHLHSGPPDVFPTSFQQKIRFVRKKLSYLFVSVLIFGVCRLGHDQLDIFQYEARIAPRGYMDLFCQFEDPRTLVWQLLGSLGNSLCLEGNIATAIFQYFHCYVIETGIYFYMTSHDTLQIPNPRPCRPVWNLYHPEKYFHRNCYLM